MKRLYIPLVAAMACSAAMAGTPAYINTSANHIEMNGADWSALRHSLANRLGGDSSVVRVLHIGDSHIQAEFVTNRLRQLLQERYGNAGRGLMAPLRLAGTNQSHDYAVTSPSKDWTQTRLLKLPWPIAAGVTGIAAAPAANTTVTWHPLGDNHKIKHATVISSNGVRDIATTHPVDSLVTDVAAGEALYGAIVENGQPGLLYSAIGNNGACFNDYLLVRDFAASTKIFAPELIVLSMGTNEAFSYMTDEEIDRSITDLVRLLRHNNPDAAFLLLTPMECQKNRNHGHKPLSPYYDINTRNAQVAKLIKEVAQREKLPVWDFYTVAGGEGCSAHWLDDALMNKDRIHLVKAGYELQAELLNAALAEQLP